MKAIARVHGFGLVPESKGLRFLFSPLVAWPLLAAGIWGIFCRRSPPVKR